MIKRVGISLFLGAHFVEYVAADETINGKLTIDQNSTTAGLSVFGGGSGAPIAEFMRDIGATAAVTIHAAADSPQMRFDDLNGATGVWSLGVAADHSFLFSNSSSLSTGVNDYFEITPQGKVGVGTPSPSARLDVFGDRYSDSLMLRAGDISTGGSGGNQILLAFNGTDDYAHAVQTRHQSAYSPGNAIDFFVWTPASGTKDDYGDNHAMSVTADGVGIGGVLNPVHKLEVNGTIRSKEVVVETTGWPDYVFGEGYELKPLSEVEEHIEKSGHLPGVPSAAEVNEGGQSLGASQRLTMQKIEELTLYIIEQEKRILELERKLDEDR